MVIPQSIRCDCCGKTVRDGDSFQIKKYPIRYGHTKWANRCDLCEDCVKIAGGGAQASTVMSIVGKAINAFKKSGGDISKAVVETSDTAAKFTICDGSKCVECDASGNCSECPNGKCSE